MAKSSIPYGSSKIRELYGDDKPLHNIITMGFDMSKPRLLLIDDIRYRAKMTSNLVSLIFVGEHEPEVDWYKMPDGDFCRISNRLLTSILFTGIVSLDLEWAQCVICFAQVAPLFSTGTKIYLEPPPTFDNKTEYNPHHEDEMINVVVGWMHHNDVYLFLASEPDAQDSLRALGLYSPLL